ncbi:NUDIX hydrolase [Leucobacter sp. GX24907]
MTESQGRARHDLIRVLETGEAFGIPPQGPPSDLPLRRSAVLILFGALDELPAGGSGDPAAPHVARELDVLLTRRATGMRHHAGEIAFPGGGEEPSDGGDPVRTALREAAEETGLDESGVEVLGMLPPITIPVSNNIVTPVVGWWRLPSEVAADHTESVDVFRAPVSELLAPTARGTSVLSRGPHTYRGPAFRLGDHLGGHLVWGFTGTLLATLFDRLGWAVEWDRGRLFHLSR